MASIKDLAQHLDISVGTISRAMNNRPGVNAKTREIVLAGARELGYVANQSGRSLRNGKTQTVGFVIETGTAQNSNVSFFMSVVDSAQAAFNEAGFDLVILPCHSADEPTAFLQRVIGRGTVDAIILTATRRHDPRIELLLNSNIPFVALGRSKVPGTYSWIDLDFEAYVQNAIKQLVKLGHKRIAMTRPATDANLGYILENAYRAALAENDLAIDQDLIFCAEQSEAGGIGVTQEILAMENRPTALLLSYEQMAIGVYGTLMEHGLKPGVDLSVTVFRRNAQMRFMDPPLSAPEFELENLGRELGEELLRVIKGKNEPLHKIWPSTFQTTQSIGPLIE